MAKTAAELQKLLTDVLAREKQNEDRIAELVHERDALERERDEALSDYASLLDLSEKYLHVLGIDAVTPINDMDLRDFRDAVLGT